jgi:hypothetical protein
LTALELALRTLLVQSTFQGYEASRQHVRAEHLEARWKRMNWPVSGEIAELFAEVFAAADDFSRAIEWYERAIEGGTGDVSLRAIEQASNLRVRRAWRLVESARDARAFASPRTRSSGRLRTALNDARRVIADETRALSKLSALNTTLERESLFGGAMKRLAMVEAEAGRRTAEARAFDAMKRHYRRAVDMGREQQASNLFYPAMNVLVADLARNAGTRQWKGLDQQVVDGARQSLRARNQADPDFWSLVGQTELRMYEVMASNTWSREAPALERGFADLFKRSQGSRHWRSVYDNADFVLSRYIRRASPKSRRAAVDLLAQLETYAGAAAPRKRAPASPRSRRA